MADSREVERRSDISKWFSQYTKIDHGGNFNYRKRENNYNGSTKKKERD
jgi:hypothetical protein